MVGGKEDHTKNSLEGGRQSMEISQIIE
jgi:hypothetical protein